MSENVIISVGVSGWYPYGVARLAHSLGKVGWAGDTILKPGEYPPGCPSHQEVPYAFKVKAFQHAIQQGHRYILWCDASAWAVKNPEPIFSIIQNQGYYLWDSGHYCDTWINDRTLSAFGLTRSQAHNIQMISANIIGIDAYHPVSMDFMKRWEWAMDQGLFNGSWVKEANDTEAPPYLGHRHDQSAASLIAHELKMKLDGRGILCQYEDDVTPVGDKVCILLRGM